MKKVSPENAVLRDKIMKGLDLAFRKLLKTKRKNDQYFAFSENGVIKKVRARDMKDQ